ncbi:DUF4265 domain-containing protein [Sorangium sp. So ce302]|uniref:DUF4265 domain-containing protein n=1 Tax=Sorangium sp. So ce302 TaxID=3133297 RepID=UPI003F5D7F23
MTHVKILFKYDSGIPDHYEVESLWAIPHEDGYQLDNIPFYAREVADGDVVTARRGPDGDLWYDSLVKPSGHSTIRLWFAREEDVQKTREELRALGCASELSDLPRLAAVDVPPNVPYSLVREKLEQGEQDGMFEFEEACLGQSS